MLRTVLTTAVLAIVAGAASAETRTSPTAWQDQVRVSVSVNMLVEAPTDSSPEALQAQEDARRKVYEVASRECAVLLDVMASDCRLESVNVSINRYHNPRQPEGFTVNGSLVLRITLK